MGGFIAFMMSTNLYTLRIWWLFKTRWTLWYPSISRYGIGLIHLDAVGELLPGFDTFGW